MPIARRDIWTNHVQRWKDCTKCPLCQQRDNICLARGQVPADIVFIGEAPGASEDATGKPFWGQAGTLFDDILKKVIDQYNPLTNAGTPSWAITNLVACFPREAKGRGDNEPEESEIQECFPRLVEFVHLCKPKLIVLVGRLAQDHIYGAAQFRLDFTSEQPEWIPDGRCLEFCKIVHPAAILRMPLAQKNMAVLKSIIVLRDAIEFMVNSSGENITNGGSKNASLTSQVHNRQQLKDAYADYDDIPF